MTFNGKESRRGALRQPQEPGVLSHTVTQAKRRKVKAGRPFPGAHQAVPREKLPFPAAFSRSLRETEAESRQRLAHPPPTRLSPAAKGSQAGTAPSPRSSAQRWALPLRVPVVPLTVLAGEGAELAARGTCGGRQGVITALSCPSRAKLHPAAMEKCLHCPCASSTARSSLPKQPLPPLQVMLAQETQPQANLLKGTGCSIHSGSV